jgi:hypothetical protein
LNQLSIINSPNPRNEGPDDNTLEGGKEEFSPYPKLNETTEAAKRKSGNAAQSNFKSINTLNLTMSTKKKSKKEVDIDQDSRSLYIFSSDNWIRKSLKSLIENPYFEGFIYHMIALNSLLLALDEPVLTDEY